MRPASFCEADAPAARGGAAAGRRRHLGAAGGALRADELGIVTDAEVRAAVADGRCRSTRRCGGSRARPCRRCRRRQLAVEAAVDMLAAGAEHLAVLDGGQVSGMLSSADLLGLDARSPIALRHTILGAADEEALVRAAGQLPHAVSAADARRRAAARARPGAQPPARRGRRAADRLLDLAARAGAGGRGPGSISAAPPAASSRWPPTRTTRWPTRIPSRTPRTPVDALLRAARRRMSTTAWSGAGSASTTTACWRAGGCGGCPRPAGCGRSTSA